MSPSYWVEALGVATYLLNILPTKTLGFATQHFALHRVWSTYDHLRVFGCACYPNLAATAVHKLAPRSTLCVFSATLLTTRDTATLTVPPIESSSLVMCPLMRPRFPLLSCLVLPARQTSSSWMILLLMLSCLVLPARQTSSSSMILLLTCQPPFDRHLLFPLQDLSPAPPRCHTRPPAFLHCHTWPQALRRRHQQARRLSPAEPGRLLASHPSRWGLLHRPSATAGPLHRRPP